MSTRAAWMACIQTVAFVAATTGALGQSGEAGSKAKVTAQRHYELGQVHYKKGEWAAALIEMRAAYELHPDPTILYWNGNIHVQLGHWQKCEEIFRRLLNEGTRPDLKALIAHNLKVCRHQLDLLRPPITINTTPPGASVRINGDSGELTGTTPWQQPLDAADYTVVCRLDGFEPLHDNFTVHEGVSGSRHYVLRPLPPPGTLKLDVGVAGTEIVVDGTSVGHSPLAEEVTLAPGPHEVELRGAGCAVEETVPIHPGHTSTLVRCQPPPPEPEINLWAWSLVGAGVVLNATGLVFTHRELAAWDDFERAASVGEQREHRDAIESNTRVARVAYGLGGAALAAGTVWLLLDKKRDRDKERAPPVAVAPAAGGAVVEFRF